jgi:hypothetical protein
MQRWQGYSYASNEKAAMVTHFTKLGGSTGAHKSVLVDVIEATHADADSKLALSSLRPSEQSLGDASDSMEDNWKMQFNGKWQNIECKNTDEWFSKMNGFSYLVRVVAAKKLLTLKKELKVVAPSDRKGAFTFHVERSFGGQEKYWKEHMPIGRTNNPAAAKASTCDGVVYSVHMWADETERILHMHFDPVDQTSGVRLLHSRRIIDDDHMEMVRL